MSVRRRLLEFQSKHIRLPFLLKGLHVLGPKNGLQCFVARGVARLIGHKVVIELS